MKADELRGLSREELVARATDLGVSRPNALTKAELVDEIVRRSSPGETRQRGWFGRARDLVATVVERGLHLPEAASLLRPTSSGRAPAPPPPLPTVTLAEIYAAQGYQDKALAVLDEVLRREPGHVEAQKLRARFSASAASEAEAGEPAAASEEAETDAPAEPSPADRSGAPETEARNAQVERRARDAAPVRGGGDGRAAGGRAPVVEPAARGAERASGAGDTFRSEGPRAAPPSEATAAGGASEPAAIPAEGPGAATTSDATAAGGTSEPATRAAATRAAATTMPGGYDVDDVVALATDAETAFVYWEVRPRSFARVRTRNPDGRLVLRVFATAPDAGGSVSTSLRDVPVDELVGDVFLRGLPPGGEVRIAIGWKHDDELRPLAVAPELQMPHRFDDARPGLSPAKPVAGPAPAPPPRYERLLERVPPLTVADVGGPPPEHPAVRRAPVERGMLDEVQRWIGGASELYGQRWREWALGGASELHRGGASELLRGGASDLTEGGAGWRGGASDLSHGPPMTAIARLLSLQ